MSYTLIDNLKIIMITKLNYIKNLIETDNVKELVKHGEHFFDDFEKVDSVDRCYKNKEDFIGKIYNGYLIIDIKNNSYKSAKIYAFCITHLNHKYQNFEGFKNNAESCRQCIKITPNKGNFKHGLSAHFLYSHYMHMISRCHNPNDDSYYKYGAIGIEVCERWRDPVDGLKNFVEDMEPKFIEKRKTHPNEVLTLDRVAGGTSNYNPENVVPATYEEQNRHLSRTKLNEDFVRLIKYDHFMAGYSRFYIMKKYSFGEDIVRGITCDPSEKRATWKNINIPSKEEYIEIFFRNFDRIDLGYQQDIIPRIKFIIFKYLDNNILKTIANFTETLNTAKTSISCMKYDIKDNHYHLKSKDECLLYIYMIKDQINLHKFPNDLRKDINKFGYIFNIRNDRELYQLDIPEIHDKYKSRVPIDIIDKIINYELFPWYKPLKFIMTPLKTN